MANKLVKDTVDKALLPYVPNFSTKDMFHSYNVGEISVKIAKLVGISDYNDMRLLGLLHDIGKCQVDPKILYKPGALTSKEFAEVMKHSLYSEQLVLSLIDDLKLARRFATIVKHHHESWDGTGYPCKLKGKDIPVESRILTIADVFEAISNPRIYRPYPISNPIAYMEKSVEQKFDKELFHIAKPVLEELHENSFMNQICYFST